jgi:lysophospholipase L1-like esterase
VATRLVALGDSTVEGLMDLGPDGAVLGWADRFAHRLAERHPGLLYANLAVRGQTAREVRETQLTRALELRPDIALLVAGVNDLLRPRLHRRELRENLLTCYRALCEAGAQVLTFTMPDMARVAPLAVVLRERIQFLNGVIREAESTYGVLVVDLASEPLAGHPALWYDDRLHGNSEGHRRVAIALAAAVGLTSEDWRHEPPPVSAPIGLGRIVGHEIGWMLTHLTPWVWGRLRHQAYATGGLCKRPDLLPVR